jgi:hypothetical protein
MHALERCLEMRITRTDVVDVLDGAEVVYPAGGGRTMSIRGRLAVCWIDDVVISVLWHTAERTAERNPIHLIAVDS